MRLMRRRRSETFMLIWCALILHVTRGQPRYDARREAGDDAARDIDYTRKDMRYADISMSLHHNMSRPLLATPASLSSHYYAIRAIFWQTLCFHVEPSILTSWLTRYAARARYLRFASDVSLLLLLPYSMISRCYTISEPPPATIPSVLLSMPISLATTDAGYWFFNASYHRCLIPCRASPDAADALLITPRHSENSANILSTIRAWAATTWCLFCWVFARYASRVTANIF